MKLSSSSSGNFFIMGMSLGLFLLSGFLTWQATASHKVPDAPIDVSARLLTANSILIYWTIADASVKIVKVERAPGPNADFSEIVQFSSAKTSYTDEGLQPNTYYRYRIKSNDGIHDSAASLEVGVATPEPEGESGSIVQTPVDPPNPTPHSVPILFRMHGSTTIGDNLARKFAEGFLNRIGAREVQTLPGATPGDYRVQGILQGQSSPTAIEVSAHGSSTAFTDLLNGSCDIGMSSRPIKPEEVTRLGDAGLGNMMSRSSENVVGLDGVALIVNQANSVEGLKMDQVRQIYSGKITDWSQVGGSLGPIIVYARAEGSGTLDTFNSLVMGSEPITPTAIRVEDSDELSGDVDKNPAAIGFVGLGSVHENKALQIADTGAEPFAPTIFTVRKGDYALTRRLYLYIPANSADPMAKRFIAYTLSEEAQKLVDSTGFVGLNLPPPRAPSVASDAPAEYKQLIQGAEDLAVGIRFVPGSTMLDSLAFRDVSRVLRRLDNLDSESAEVILIGFGDDTGNPKTDLGLSMQRAQVVQREFEAQGFEPSVVKGFGEALPVASNGSAESRERNRRVEIWVRKGH